MKTTLERNLTLKASARKSELGPVESVEAPSAREVVVRYEPGAGQLRAAARRAVDARAARSLILPRTQVLKLPAGVGVRAAIRARCGASPASPKRARAGGTAAATASMSPAFIAAVSACRAAARSQTPPDAAGRCSV